MRFSKHIFPFALTLLALAMANPPCHAAESGKATEFTVLSSAKIKLGGYLRTYYSAAKRSADNLGIRFARIKADARLPDLPGWRLFLLLDLKRTPVLVDGVLEYSVPQLLVEGVRAKARAGQFRPPFSREAQVPIGSYILLDRSAAVKGLVPGWDVGTIGRDIGAMTELGFSLPSRKNLLVGGIGIFNGEGANTADLNSQKDMTSRVVLNPCPGLSLGGSHSQGRLGATSRIKNRIGWDAKLSYGPASLVYEQIYGKTDFTSAKGQYAMAAFWFLPKRLVGAYRYDWYDPDLGASSDRSFVHTLGVTGYPHKAIRLSAEYRFLREEGAQLPNDATRLAVQFQF